MPAKYSRKYPRMKADFAVQCQLDGKTFQERASMFGGGGMFINARQPLPLGAELEVRFRAAKHLPVIDAKARVCYLVPAQGAALEFTEIAPESRRQLLRFIHHKTASQRAHRRASLAAQIQFEEGMALAFARDVSAGGMFIETTRPLSVGTRLTLRFSLDDGRSVMVANGEVIYHAGNIGMGVQFLDLSPENLTGIESYVAQSESAAEPSGTTGAAN